MNFKQRQAARESVSDDIILVDQVDLPQDTVEGALAEVEEDTKQIDISVGESEVMAEDGDEIDDQLSALDEQQAAADGTAPAEDDEGNPPVEAEDDMSDDAVNKLDVAVESIRRRWMMNDRPSVAQESFSATHKRTAARESLWDTIKQFLKDIIDWVKEQFAKLKSRWIKFRNQGKSIQKRSKQFDAVIRNLGTKKKDDVSGSFIKQLSVGASFKGDDVATLNATLTAIANFQNVQEEALGNVKDLVDRAVNSKAELKKTSSVLDGRASTMGGELLGGKVVKIEKPENGEADDLELTVVDTEASIETSVSTPSVQQLNSLNTFFNKLGIEIEKRCNAWDKIERASKAYTQSMEKLSNSLDKMKVDDDAALTENARKARRAISHANSLVSRCESVSAHLVKCLSAGVNGYIAAGVGAYEKRKAA